MNYELCDWCLSWSPRMNVSRRCCQVRNIMGMPKGRRQAVYSAVDLASGRAALLNLKADVIAEYKRKVAATKK